MTKQAVRSERDAALSDTAWEKRELKSLLAEVKSLRSFVRSQNKLEAETLAASHPDCRASVRNLLHSLALSRKQVEPLGERLAARGLTRLARRERSALAVLDAVRGALQLLNGKKKPPRLSSEAVSRSQGRRLLQGRAEAILGSAPKHGSVRILAALTKHDAGDGDLIRRLVASDINGIQIEASDGDVGDWSTLVEQIRREADRQQRPQQILMTLPGPMIKTEELAKGAAVLRWEPPRNQRGKLLSPARLWLNDQDQGEAPVQPVEAVLPVSLKLLREMRTEDVVRFKDARGRRRELRIRGAGRSGCLAETVQTTYVESAAPLRLERQGKLIARGHVGTLPRLDRPLMLFPGDLLNVTREQLLGRPAVRDGDFLRSPARISCTAPEIIGQVRAKERIAFGDGTIAGVIESVSVEELRIRITSARSDGSELKPGVSMRFPDSALVVPALGSGDQVAVSFAARHVDAVVLPSVERPEDVLALGKALDQQAGKKLGVVLGIETRRGVVALPRLLLAALRRPSVAVRVSMEALAVEYGSARLGEVLEQIRWLTRSAHVPLIFSVPALDRLARHGILNPIAIRNAIAGAHGEGLVIGESEHLAEIVQYLTAPEHDSRKSDL